MNILNVCDTEGWDIVAYQALHTASRFLKLGHNASVLCPKNSRLSAECRKLKINVREMGLGAKFGFFAAGGWDIVHFYNPSTLSPMLLKKTGAASRVFITQLKLGSQENFLKLASFAPYVAMYAGACNSVQEELIRAGVDKAKTFLVPPALNIGRWESAMLIKPAMFLKRPYKVGTVSMDKSLKEQELFLLMAKEVLEVLPDTDFMVVGLKNDKIRDFARSLGISSRVDVLWERNDIPEVMAMMHIYVKTALRDGMSMSLLEAQASGVACIIPRLKGLSDFTVNDHNGLIVEPGDIFSYTRAVSRLISNPALCGRMSKMAFDYVNNNMTLPVVCNILLRLYEDSLG